MISAPSIAPDLWSAVRHHYESESWSSAMLDAINHLGDTIRTKSGLLSDGAALVGQAFDGKDPKIKLSRLITESELNVQQGTASLIRGLYQAVRNPRSHGKVEDSRADADAIISFVSYLLIQLGHARSAFSVEGVLDRLRDRNFVPNERYAALILSEIPQSKLLDTLVAAFENLPQDARPLSSFFDIGIKSLGASDRQHFFDAVTTHLMNTQSDQDLRAVFQCIGRDHWASIGEAARLRCEHWIGKDIQGGRRDPKTRKYHSGALSTWATSYFPKFSLKEETANIILRGLQDSDPLRSSYSIEFFGYIDELLDNPTPLMVRIVKSRLSAGDAEVLQKLESILQFQSDQWAAPFKEAMEKFKPRESVPDDFSDDDIPF